MGLYLNNGKIIQVFPVASSVLVCCREPPNVQISTKKIGININRAIYMIEVGFILSKTHEKLMVELCEHAIALLGGLH